jgi:hypothetical protein
MCYEYFAVRAGGSQKWTEKDLMPKNWMNDLLKGYPNWVDWREATF